MKLSVKTKKILKIVTLAVFVLLEIYLIYAAVASINTYHKHPRFVSADGQEAQSSGYRTQFYICVIFSVVIPLLAGLATYMFYFKKSASAKTVTEGAPVLSGLVEAESAASSEDAVGARDPEIADAGGGDISATCTR